MGTADTPELQSWTDASFDAMSWHDCVIRSIGFAQPDLDDDGRVPDLVLDIDYIVDWPCDPGCTGLFSVAPAKLLFRLVTDLRIDVGWPDTGYAVAPGLPVIYELVRDEVAVHHVLPGGRYFRWTMRLAEPRGGTISFGAAGFRMELTAAPVQTAEQWLSAAERGR